MKYLRASAEGIPMVVEVVAGAEAVAAAGVAAAMAGQLSG
jgi:hypothetical protein